MDGGLAGDGFSYGGLERGKQEGQDGPQYGSLAVKTVQYMDKTSYLGCEESFIPCQNTVRL